MILVTGGAGYIGSHTALELMRSGEKVVVYDNLIKGHRGACERIGVELIVGDIRDREKMNEIFRKYDIQYVIHFAAESLVGESMKDPLKYYDNNVYGTCCLIKSMIDHEVKGIVFSSTAAVYGEPKNIPIIEQDDKSPTNTYGETKLAVEKMLDWARAAHGLNYVALRYFNAAGADDEVNVGEDHHPETHLIPLVLKTALGQNPYIQVFGDNYPTEDGTCVRDYIHVRDLANAHIKALKKLDEKNSCIYNLGNGIGFTVKEVIEKAREITGKTITANIVEPRKGDPATLIASSKGISEELGWIPQYSSINNIVDTAWNWHRKNPNGYLE
jgi:UDP-glucose 4-epimerase